VQVFSGIFTGLNISSVDVKTCVKDATNIPAHFQASFQAFEDRAIYKGIHLLGVALGDIVAGMIDCGVKQALTGRIKAFVEDLVSCVDKGLFRLFIFLFNFSTLIGLSNIFSTTSD